MVGLIDRLRRNKVFAFVLALTLACAMALPTLGFADEEAVVAGQVAVQAEAGIAGSTDFDETVGQEQVEESGVCLDEDVETADNDSGLNPSGTIEGNMPGRSALLSDELSSECKILSLSINGIEGSIIHPENNTGSIHVYVPWGTDFDSLEAVLQVSEGATFTYVPGPLQSISYRQYEVVAEDGVTIGNYILYVVYDAIPSTDFGIWSIAEGGTVSAIIEADMVEHEFSFILRQGQKTSAYLGTENFVATDGDGTTVITLTEDYLKSLGVGEYVFDVNFRGGDTHQQVRAHPTLTIVEEMPELEAVGFGEWSGSGTISAVVQADMVDDGFRGLYSMQSGDAYERDVDYTAVDGDGTTTITFTEETLKKMAVGVQFYFSANFDTGRATLSLICLANQDPALSSDKEIKRFTVNGVEASIDPFPGDSDPRYFINLHLPYGSVDLTSVEPLIEISEGATISPTGPQNFRNGGVVYIVTAEDGTTREYHATVSFDWLVDSFEDWSGKGTTSVVVDVPLYKFGSQLLDATNPNHAFDMMPVLVRGQDYTIHGEGSKTVITLTESYLSKLEPGDYAFATSLSDGGSLWLDLTVTEPVLSSDKDITSLKVGDTEGVIDGTDITVLLPAGTDVTAVTPTIVHTGVSISPTGPQDFSNGPVSYTVTAEDGTTETYSVSVLAVIIHATDAGTYTGSETKTSTVNAPVADFVTLHRITPDAEVELTLNEDYTVSAAPTAGALSTLAAGDTGSTLITFTESYLSTLAEGTYDYIATYRQGVAPFTMTVDLAAVDPAPEKPVTDGDTATTTEPGDTTSVPKTGDGAIAMLLVAGLLVLGGISLVVVSGRRCAGRHLR